MVYTNIFQRCKGECFLTWTSRQLLYPELSQVYIHSIAERKAKSMSQSVKGTGEVSFSSIALYHTQLLISI